MNSKSQGLGAGESQAPARMVWEGFLQEMAVGELYLSPAAVLGVGRRGGNLLAHQPLRHFCVSVFGQRPGRQSWEQEPFKLDSTPTLPLASQVRSKSLTVSDFRFFYEMVKVGAVQEALRSFLHLKNVL